MTFIILFQDNPDADPAIRQRHMPEHLAFLEKNSDVISAAGPLSDAAGSAAGGLWIVDGDDRDEVEALVHADPFWPTGLRASFDILHWRKVFADGRKL